MLISPGVFAQSFEVQAQAINNRIDISEFAEYRIKISNDNLLDDVFRITNLNFPTWDVRTDPIANPITLELGPGENGSIDILVDPLKIKEIGTYAINVIVKSTQSGETIPLSLKVSVLSTDSLLQGYVPTVTTSVNIPEN